MRTDALLVSVVLALTPVGLPAQHQLDLTKMPMPPDSRVNPRQSGVSGEGPGGLLGAQDILPLRLELSPVGQREFILGSQGTFQLVITHAGNVSVTLPWKRCGSDKSPNLEGERETTMDVLLMATDTSGNQHVISGFGLCGREELAGTTLDLGPEETATIIMPIPIRPLAHVVTALQVRDEPREVAVSVRIQVRQASGKWAMPLYSNATAISLMGRKPGK
jgi:hypothetical protein